MPNKPSLLDFSTSCLLKARRELARELVEFCCDMIASDGSTVPAHQRDWKIGQSFSWHYVHIVEYRVQQLTLELELMAGKNASVKKKNSNVMDQYQFVRCELSAEDKKAAKVWIEENTTDFGPLLHDAVASDYKFSLSFSSEHDTFTACLTGKPDNAINGYKTLTARHKDWIVASLTLLYKTNVMFKNGVWETDIDEEDDGWA